LDIFYCGYCDCLCRDLLWIVLVFKLSNSKSMKARVKDTGEIIDVESRFYAIVGSTNPIIHNSLLEILEDDKIIDWEQRRYELIKELFLKWTGIDDIKREVIIKEHIRICIQTADALLEELKKGKA